MSQNYRPKLSLVAQFDDINRLSGQLGIGIENEFITFIRAQENLRQELNQAFKTIEKKDHDLLKAKKEKDAFEIKLRHARSLIETEMHKRLKIEQEKKSLERQITIIKEVLLADQHNLNDQAKEKLAFLSASMPHRNLNDISPRLTPIEESLGSLLTTSDLSFDKTDDDLDNDIRDEPSKNKRSSSHSQKSHKRAKLEDSNSSSTDNVDQEQRTKYHTMNTRSKRCSSEPAPNSEVVSPPRTICKSENNPFDAMFVKGDPELFNRKLSGGTPMRRFSSTGKMNRAHNFCSKTIIKPEMCYPCGKRIGFYKPAAKCQDCRVTCHHECKDKVPLPCYPLSHTPTGKGITGTIADYAANGPPFIPAILVHCINEIETRGLEEVGLYRVSGSEREVKDLKEKFLKGKCVPCLNKIDIHAICGTIKEFLRSLNEPLITRKLWQNFVNAAEVTHNEDAICDTVNILPLPNRDTLAYLILHLHRVAQSPRCLMPIENLAKVFAPTIIGYSSAEPIDTNMISETKSQTAVMQSLLEIPSEFWENFIGVDNGVFRTPEVVRDGNRLGPISTSATLPYKPRSTHYGKTPLTPRNEHGTRTTTRPKKPFFASPMLK